MSVREDVVTTEARGSVLIVRLNRPEKLNAWTFDLGEQYHAALLAADDDPTVRAIVVTGAGRGFCAGSDTGRLQSADVNRATEHRTWRHGFVTRMKKPVIAAINGPCIGVGFVVAMMCDRRFAAQDAKVGPGLARLGLIAENGLAWTLPRVVGQSAAFHLLTSPDLLDARSAQAMGIIDEIVGGVDIVDAAVAYAEDLTLRSSPSAIATIKRQLSEGWELGLEAADRRAEAYLETHLGHSDFKEAVTAMSERRPPQFASLESDGVDGVDGSMDGM